MKKCERCPNRPCRPSSAACDNCLAREEKAALENVLVLEFTNRLKLDKEVSGDA